jgi:hypothetical protein
MYSAALSAQGQTIEDVLVERDTQATKGACLCVELLNLVVSHTWMQAA